MFKEFINKCSYIGETTYVSHFHFLGKVIYNVLKWRIASQNG